MTATLQPETKSPSRRALLAGALGGIGVWATSAIGRASPMQAANGGPVVLGSGNLATALTGITNTSAGSTTLHCSSTGAGTGVSGSSQSGFGIRGESSGIGVSGTSHGPSQPASLGQSVGNSTGMLGVSGSTLPTAKPKTGVYGYANQDNTASAVYGLSPLGVGIRGHSASGYAGYFEGRVYTNAWYELGEVVGNPAPPFANRARLFVRDNGAGKTQLCVRFHTGGVQIIKTEL
jgi:hypothetical protein